MNSPAQATDSRSTLLSRPWYPFVAAVYPLWFIFLANFGQVSWFSAVAASAFALAVVGVLMWAGARLLRSRPVAALIVTVLLAAFFGYGPLHDALLRISSTPEMPDWLGDAAYRLSKHLLLSLTVLFICAGLVFRIVKRRARNSDRFTGACNIAALTLAGILAVRLGIALWDDRHFDVRAADAPGLNAGRQLSVLGYNPDIYYIILDGYARADVLREFYGFDNSPFIAALEQRGFAVNDASRTNYYWTFLSLASSLNYDYLQDFAAPILADRSATSGRAGFGKVSRLVQDNRAARFLRARGYRFVHLQSSSPETVRNRYADEQVGCAGRLFDDEYFRTVAEASWLKILGSLASTDLAECHQLRLVALGDQAKRAGPKFVFAHFLPPHHPYLFDRDGNILQHVTISNQFDFQAKLWEDKAAYLEQVQYTNRTLLEVIDRIRAESARPPVIFVQSDHGPNLRERLTPQQVLAARLPNFAAYLLPETTGAVLPRDCAPVNQFRYLFNHLFEAGLPILPNKSYYSAFDTPLEMSEVMLDTPAREPE